jgi:hypothetical protein
VRIFNVSFIVDPTDDSLALTCQSINVVLAFLDGSLNTIQLPSGAGFELVLKQVNYTSPAPMGVGIGFGISAEGDPLVEVVSGLLVTNFTAVNGVNIGGFQLQCGADLNNTDAVNSHTATGVFSALLSFVPRS